MAKKTNPPATEVAPPPAPASAESLFAPAVALVKRMVEIENDPDLKSVFSIARAHGYVTTSRLWYQELNTLGAALQAYSDAKEPKEPQKDAAVIPISGG